MKIYNTIGTPLSNFCYVPNGIKDPTYPITYYSVEHAYQAQKLVGVEKRIKLSLIRKNVIFGTDSPNGIDLKFGREAKKFIVGLPIRRDWNGDLKLKIMEDLLDQKFSYPLFRNFLNETKGREIVELCSWDSFWGRNANGFGKNYLGLLLTRIRDRVQ
jgi:ribA/ribD-fused uncharacterized protein